MLGLGIRARRKKNVVAGEAVITYRCDGCGRSLSKDALRYTVKIDVRAAYDELEVSLADLIRDHRTEILAIIEQLKNRDPHELEDSVYKGFKLDLCPACQRAYIRDPLRFRPGQVLTGDEVDIDGFLKSLGIGVADEEPETPEDV
jgi:hypothetical protein